MADEDNSPLGGPLELPGDETPPHQPQAYAPLPKDTNKAKYFFIVLGVIVLAGLIYMGWKLYSTRSKSTNQAQTAQSTSQTKPQIPQDAPETTGTKTYTNDTLALELTYPDTWTVTESDTKDGVKFESPEFAYTTTDGTDVTGNFRVYIRKGARDVDSKYIGRGYAVIPSQQLAYTKPVSGQSNTTYISFFGLDQPDNFAYFFIAHNFNLKKGETFGPNYGQDSGTYIITGGYSSKDLKDDMATNMVPAGTFQQTVAYKQAIGIIKSLQLN